jgi:hypothetical protein
MRTHFTPAARLLLTLLPHALRLDIEGSYCCWVIAKRRFRAPSPTQRIWPWPIRIKAMGYLEVLLDGAPLRVSRKAQRRPLDLLKLLVTQGRADATHPDCAPTVRPPRSAHWRRAITD